MEEPSGTGSRGKSRDQVSAGAAVAFDRRRQPHLTNHIDAAISRFQRCAIDGEARQSPPDWVELRPGRDDRTPRTSPRTIRTPVGAPLLVGGGVTGSNLRVPRRRPVLVRSGLRSFEVADHVRAGMEVMSIEDDSEPAACAPAGAQQQLRVGPGPILTDRSRGSVPRLPRLPGSASCERHPEYGGI